MSDFLIMCIEFFKTGLFAIGGGLATLPFLRDIATNHPDWFTVQDMADMLAVAESTPGPIGVNMSTYAGFKSFGLPGGICTTLSLVLPSFIIVLIVSKIWEKYKKNEKVMKIFSALRAAAIGLIISASVDVFITAVFKPQISLSSIAALAGSINLLAIILFAVIFAIITLTKKKNIHPIVFILCSALLGIILKL